MVMKLTFPRPLRNSEQPSTLDVHKLPMTMTRMTAKPGKHVEFRQSGLHIMRKKALMIQASSQVER